MSIISILKCALTHLPHLPSTYLIWRLSLVRAHHYKCGVCFLRPHSRTPSSPSCPLHCLNSLLLYHNILHLRLMYTFFLCASPTVCLPHLITPTCALARLSLFPTCVPHPQLMPGASITLCWHVVMCYKAQGMGGKPSLASLWEQLPTGPGHLSSGCIGCVSRDG